MEGVGCVVDMVVGLEKGEGGVGGDEVVYVGDEGEVFGYGGFVGGNRWIVGWWWWCG